MFSWFKKLFERKIVLEIKNLHIEDGDQICYVTLDKFDSKILDKIREPLEETWKREQERHNFNIGRLWLLQYAEFNKINRAKA